jgi:CheY-like chemotaxis protein
MVADNIDIILVEDNIDDANLAIRALRKNGINNSLVHLKDGEEAIDFIFCKGIYSRRTLDELPKLILLDLKMPKIDGFEVLRQVKSDARTSLIPVVLLTSSNQEKDILKSYHLGANSYIVKPVEFGSYVKTVGDTGSYWLQLNHLPH